MMEYSLPVDIPEGAIVKSGVSVVSYFGEDGKIQYRFEVDGEEPITSYLGLLKLVERDILSWSNHGRR